ncbi:MAG: hypothetical protein ACREQV_09295 [Candidatus Binatia bacterium]
MFSSEYDGDDGLQHHLQPAFGKSRVTKNPHCFLLSHASGSGAVNAKSLMKGKDQIRIPGLWRRGHCRSDYFSGFPDRTPVKEASYYL